MTEIEVICTFDKSPQTIQVFEFDESPSEAEFLCTVLSEVDRKTLVKISACQLLRSSTETRLSWLIKTNGKYYFNV